MEHSLKPPRTDSRVEVAQGETIRIMIVDDHPAAADGVKSYLETETDLQVVEICDRGERVVEAARRCQPHVVIMDLVLDGSQVDGLAAARALHADCPSVRVLIVSAYKDERRVLAASDACVAGYIVKTSPRRSIIQAVRSVVAGQVAFDPDVWAIIQRYLHQPGDAEDPSLADDHVPGPSGITDTELKVVELIAKHKTNKQIALAMNVAESTIKTHVHNILVKLNLDDRKKVAVWYGTERRL